jgi:putative YphP/YqiW family bacilliredoxin
MPYDPAMVQPMREELTSIGVKELRTADEVDAAFTSSGTTLLVINSVCGCAAGMARPGVRLALDSDVKPDQTVTVFAGQDLEAVSKARAYFPEIPPSSPFFALLKDGKVVHAVPRHHIEGQDAVSVANNLVASFNEHCKKTTA